ncbi:MAG: glucosaminidase domain-containing protein [Candidatus Cryptobacteroides sp.]
MRKPLTILLLISVAIISIGATSVTPQDDYIRKYSATAVREMYRSGVPASITLAQGLLESRYGQSELAVKGNNHFGIKCHDWTGKKMYYDDDAKGECFRVYSSADESFRDHSDFLRYRDRYKFLFDYDVTDYKSWAYGLKKAGYATDPSYPSKLIKIIEDYHLYDYDIMTSAPSDEAVKEAGKKAGKRKRQKRPGGAQQEAVVIPESPHSIEEPKRLTREDLGEKFTFSLSRKIYSINGVKFIYANEGETYSSIADKYDLFPKEILRFNDTGSDRSLMTGEVVYIQAKKTRAAKGMDKYISDEGGETMRELSQRFGLKLKNLCKMNGRGTGYVSQPGDEFVLR